MKRNILSFNGKITFNNDEKSKPSANLPVSESLAKMIENIPRILPQGRRAKLKKKSWPIPPIFHVMQQIGNVEGQEMYTTFNMGIGMVLVCDQINAREIMKSQNVYQIGEIV